jgi:hypothetical protein
MPTLPFMLVTTALLGLTMSATVPAQQAPQSQTQQQAPAQPAGDNQSALPSFGDLDKEHHGYLTRSEIPKDVEGLKSLRAHFRESDSNGNGRLEPSEYAAYVEAQAPASSKAPGSP